jgi:hypothetical protein
MIFLMIFSMKFENHLAQVSIFFKPGQALIGRCHRSALGFNKNPLQELISRRIAKVCESRDEKNARYLLSESCSGYFMRSFSLPNLVDESRVDAQYADGVLTITVPKTEASKAKQIKIH